jgi:beta-phosphoglucomutase-like phosphatase (HAD superfamily)
MARRSSACWHVTASRIARLPRCRLPIPHPYSRKANPCVHALLFDLDGTLVDSVYQHVLAWQEALERCDIQLAVWRIHRRIGMSGGLLVNALLRETARSRRKPRNNFNAPQHGIRRIADRPHHVMPEQHQQDSHAADAVQFRNSRFQR